jgi:hypothetical protein
MSRARCATECSTPFTTLKIATVEPIARPSVDTIVAANAGRFSNERLV